MFSKEKWLFKKCLGTPKRLISGFQVSSDLPRVGCQKHRNFFSRHIATKRPYAFQQVPPPLTTL